MHRLRDGHFIAQVQGWRHAQAAAPSRRHVTENIAVEIGSQDDIKARRLLHHPVSRRIHQQLVGFNIIIVAGDFIGHAPE